MVALPSEREFFWNVGPTRNQMLRTVLGKPSLICLIKRDSMFRCASGASFVDDLLVSLSLGVKNSLSCLNLIPKHHDTINIIPNTFY